MEYPVGLRWGRLVRRWQRFLSEVQLNHGLAVIAHVPNSGAMRGCAEPGSPVLLSPVTGRKLAWRLEQVVAGGVTVGVNTQLANRLAEEALTDGLLDLPGEPGAWEIEREVPVGGGTRLDFRLTGPAGCTWLEVKNVTWAERGVALFPDAVTVRGRRHLEVLTRLAESGSYAALVYVVQRGDARAVRAASQVDPAYSAALERARGAGVMVRAVQVAVSPGRLKPWRSIPVLAGSG